MKKMLNVTLYVGGKKVANGSKIILESCAPDIVRKFHFPDLCFDKELEQLIINADELRITVAARCKCYSRKQELYTIKLQLMDWGNNLEWVSGCVKYDSYAPAYRQGVIDIFHLWEKNEKLNWFELPLYHPYKGDYSRVCLFYSGIRTNIIDKLVYIIDMRQVREYRDVIYLLGDALFADKGYIGHSFHTLKDCIQIIGEEHNRFKDKTFIFENAKNLSIVDDASFFDDFITYLLKWYDCTVIINGETMPNQRQPSKL